MQPKTLITDIETAPIRAFVWRCFKENIGFNQIANDWHMLSFCAKWLHKPDVLYYDQSKRRNYEDDRVLLGRMHKLLTEADIVVAHNGKKFDMRKINARLIMNGYRPPAPYKVVDTLLEARKAFGFTSNRLAALTKQLVPDTVKDDHKEFPGFELWDECLKRNPRAWAVMREYNIQDVLSLEALYLKLRPWMEGHPNVGAYLENDKPTCPKCGSTNMRRQGYRMTQVGKYSRFQCTDCGGWARGRLTENSKQVRKHLLIQ